MKDGHFVDQSGEPLLGGEEVVIALLQRCLIWADLVLERYVHRLPAKNHKH